GHLLDDALPRSQLAHLSKLIAKIFQRKAVAGERFGGELLGFFLVHLLFSFFDKRENVAHAQNAADDAVRVKRFQRVVLFADTDELDGLAGDVANTERGPAAGAAIHLGENDAGERELLVELVSR